MSATFVPDDDELPDTATPSKYAMEAAKRKRDTSPTDRNSSPSKKLKANEKLLQLLDFSALNHISAISDRFDQVGNTLLHDYILVVRHGEVETEFRILELEFYLQKPECHEDPFTHGSEEQKFCGRWYFHRAPRRSADSHRSLTSLTGYRGGTRKGLDLTIGSPTNVTSPYFPSSTNSCSGSITATEAPLLRGGALLRTLQRIPDSKVVSGPSVLVDQILLLFEASSISDLVEHKWARDTSAFPTSDPPKSASLYLKPLLSSEISRKPPVYRSPRIGLELSHPGTTATLSHPRVFFLSQRYRYFVQPHLLTSNGRAQTFLGVLQGCLDTGDYGETPLKNPSLHKALADTTGLKSPTVAKYIADYQAGMSGGSLKSFVGPSGKGAAGSPSTYLNMMGTLSALRLDAKETVE